MKAMNYRAKSVSSLSLLWLLSIIVFFACGDDKTEPMPNMGDTGKISLSTNFIDLTCEAVSEEVSLSSDAAWQVKNTADWLSITPTEGEAGNNQSLRVDVTENTTSMSRTAKIVVEMTSGATADTLTVRQAGVSPYVDIDWEEDATLSRFDLASGEVKINFLNEVPSFTPGISAIIVPTDTLTYIRVVNAAEVNGSEVTLRTNEGSMANLFMNQEFTLSTVPMEAKVSTRSGMPITTDDKGVIHPTRITTYTEDGSEVVLYDAENPSVLRNMTVHEDFNFFYKERDFTGETIFEEDGARLVWDKGLFQASLDAEFYFSFGESTVLNEDLNIEVPTGDLLGFYYLLKGSVNADILLHLIAEQERSGAVSEVPLWKHIFGPKGTTITFTVGNVPVMITIDPSIMGEAAYHSEMRGDLTGGLNTGLEVNVGVNYYKDNGAPQAVGSINPHFTLYEPAITVKGTVEGSACLYPDFSVMFYNFAGPRVQIKPTLGDEMRFGGAAGNVEHEYAAWTNRLYQKLEAFGQLNLNFVGRPYHSPFFSLIPSAEEVDIYRTPEDIEFLTESVEMQLGQSMPLTVNVTDYCSLFDTPPASVGAVVEFEATNGMVDLPHAITNEEGHATVTFTPTGENASLTARILDADGEEIASDVFKPILNVDRSFDIVGTWYAQQWRNYPEYKNELSIHADGTFEYIFDATYEDTYRVNYRCTEISGTYKYKEGFEIATAYDPEHPGVWHISSDSVLVFPYYTWIIFTPNDITDNYYALDKDTGEKYFNVPDDYRDHTQAMRILRRGGEVLVQLLSTGKVSTIAMDGAEHPVGAQDVDLFFRVSD